MDCQNSRSRFFSVKIAAAVSGAKTFEKGSHVELPTQSMLFEIAVETVGQMVYVTFVLQVKF